MRELRNEKPPYSHTGRDESRLERALTMCRSAARRGYEIARENLRESARAIDGVSKSLSRCLKSLEDGSVRTPGIADQLKRQLSDVVNKLKQLQRTSESTLEERHKRLDTFSVALFGRTLAGKSTLMEILTRGDGRSIGTGAQRTTRDVRSYLWKGLQVTDVPGVAAFEGTQDEELAFRAASQADLVLFLITDDAPQSVEAECLARVRRLGKPVLGICNVKAAVDDEDDLRLFLRNSGRHFDRTRIGQLLQQFHAFADQHIPGERVPFLVTHLRSRFLAQLTQQAQHRDRLLAASR
ncbi:MAG: GTPase [Gemmataceae bacterium]